MHTGKRQRRFWKNKEEKSGVRSDIIKKTIFHFIQHYGYAGIFSSLVLGIAGLPIPDETILSFVGYLIYKGHLQFLPAVTAAFLGSVSGITLSYGLGRSIGFYLTKHYGHIIHVTEHKLNRVHNWFDRMGKWTLVFGYFVPGVRHLTAFVAGTSKMQMSLFAIFAYTGGLLWSITFISIGYFLSEKWVHTSRKVHHYIEIGSGIVLVLLLIYFFVQKRRQNRRTGG